MTYHQAKSLSRLASLVLTLNNDNSITSNLSSVASSVYCATEVGEDISMQIFKLRVGCLWSQ